MAAVTPDNLEEVRSYAPFLKLIPLADGREPESRVVYSGISWENYLAIDKARGEDVPYPRFYYLDGELEIMSTSGEHGRTKKWLADLLAVYFEEAEIEVVPEGQATMRSALQQVGAEPDESWYIGRKNEFPDLVLEIALTSGGIRKLELYQRFQVSEVWFWRRGRLELFALRGDGSGYEALEGGSRLLPGLDVGLLERCVAIPSWLEARRTFRTGLVAGEAAR